MVLSALDALLLKARIASSRAPGAIPNSLRCEAMAPAMPVPCGCGLSFGAGGVETAGDDAFEIGMAAVDFRIDHGDRNVGPLDCAMDIGKVQLAEHVLSGVALRGSGGGGGGGLGGVFRNGG